MTAEIRIPSLGESVTEGVIVSWRKQDGDLVAPDEILLEIETDKASVEIPSETGGVLRILRREGETVAVGEVVARIETDRGRAHPGPSRPADGGAPAGEKARTQRVAATADETERPGERPPLRQVAAEVRATPEASKAAEPPRRGIGPLSPAVRRLVGEHDLDPTVIPATGRGGRLTAEDVRAYVTRQEEGDGAVPSPATVSVPPVVPPVAASHAAVPGTAAPTSRAAAPGLSTPGAADTGGTAVEERVPMGRIRKRIAERLVQAQHTAAILTTFNEIDMSAVLALRAEHRERFRERHGVDLGLLSFFARASIAALAEFPAINAEIRGEDIVYKRFVHLGIAVGTPQGLVVPVLRHAERMSFADIEREIARLAARAREGKVSVDDLSGGTFTISNGGVYGSLLSTPILNPPQSGILGMHKIEKRPVVIDDQIVVRPMMYVALSYDHRIVDGEQAVTFLVRVKTRLEQPTRLLLDV